MVQSGKMKISEALSCFDTYVKYHNDPNSYRLTAEMKAYFSKMNIFCIGHDKMYRPIVYIHTKMIKKQDFNVLLDCLSFIYLAIEQVFMKKYFVENLCLVFDLEGLGILNFPFKAMKGLIDITTVRFSGKLHKIYFANPSTMFFGIWKIVRKFCDPVVNERIEFIKSSKMKDFLRTINEDQLLEAYGGSLKTPKSVFPFVNTFRENETPEFPKPLTDTYMPEAASERSNENDTKNNEKIDIKTLQLKTDFDVL